MVMTATGDMVVPLLGTPGAAGVARILVDQRMHNWGYSHILHDVLLISSELVTNAAQRTPQDEIRLQLSRDADGIIVAVWDAAPDLPQPRARVDMTLDDLDLSEDAFDENGGWGLQIVQELSARCGAVRDPVGGKWIWARILI
ncbi:ATP-binding protein [Actinomadura decatromicini]|uniref:ATP-binding protein n=1 Tax=Actinomadura decatromicini TaxID=2604572 RepID=A0A5D3FZD5_9ACTN|nr:ATP-binding protein [Actinomadura decatromicini]TYK52545.1 ATP-binding protein [Actinomadura decatromicini]